MARRERVVAAFQSLQERITAALEQADGVATFREDAWERPGGGGGRARVIQNGGLFEKGGVNFSAVHGELPEPLARSMGPGPAEFFATGVSLVLHPRSPRVPTVHANYRYFERGDAIWWFGGGADLTPYYPALEDVRHFHRVHHDVCERHEPGRYARFKAHCDRYFFLPHRNETRGIGGIFFDNQSGDFESLFVFQQEIGAAFLDAYLPIAERRRSDVWGEREREFQLHRRGRYVEFNLAFDRGTHFGLQTNGRAESILMSLPPEVRWTYAYEPPAGSEEARLLPFLRAHDWLGLDGPMAEPG